MITSPYLSHDLYSLYEMLKPEYIIWGVNDPKFTITSFYNKGWYRNKVVRNDESLVYGPQPGQHLNRSFGRIIPRGEEYEEWQKLTIIGKLSWLYNTVNMEIFKNIIKIPKENVFIYKLEEADQNYNYYLNYAHKFGLRGIFSKEMFLSIKELSVNPRDNVQKEWTEIETQEFNKYVKKFYLIYNNLK